MPIRRDSKGRFAGGGGSGGGSRSSRTASGRLKSSGGVGNTAGVNRGRRRERNRSFLAGSPVPRGESTGGKRARARGGRAASAKALTAHLTKKPGGMAARLHTQFSANRGKYEIKTVKRTSPSTHKRRR